MLSLGIVLVIVICTTLSIRTKTLLIAALWLALTSAAAAALLYSLGAHEIAVIELSVGTGLVPVLFVFAVSLLGKQTSMPPPVVPRPAALGLVLICLVLLALMIFPTATTASAETNPALTFGSLLWGDRGLDMLVQGVLIFASVISVLNLLVTTQRGRGSVELQQEAR
jgi:NADH:ubiquinone oxidoreductase subunit 6 (subunit J)